MGRPAPTYWWDFTAQTDGVVVQSDWPGGSALAVFRAPAGQTCLDAQIGQAEALIADFKAGRKTPQWGAVSLDT